MANPGHPEMEAPVAPEPRMSAAEWMQADCPGSCTVLVNAGDDLDEQYPLLLKATALVLEFPTFMDGRGFSHGRRLRDMGYTGILLAGGEVLSDQEEFLRRCGFDGLDGPALGGEPDFSGFTAQYQSR